MYKDTCAHNILFMVGIQNLNGVDAQVNQLATKFCKDGENGHACAQQYAVASDKSVSLRADVGWVAY